MVEDLLERPIPAPFVYRSTEVHTPSALTLDRRPRILMYYPVHQ